MLNDNFSAEDLQPRSGTGRGIQMLRPHLPSGARLFGFWRVADPEFAMCESWCFKDITPEVRSHSREGDRTNQEKSYLHRDLENPSGKTEPNTTHFRLQTISKSCFRSHSGHHYLKGSLALIQQVRTTDSFDWNAPKTLTTALTFTPTVRCHTILILPTRTENERQQHHSNCCGGHFFF